MELWLHKRHFVEAKAWASTALQQIAQLSGIDPSSQKSLAEAMFKTPSKVWGRMHKLTEDSALPVQRALFMDFSPVPATKSAEKKQPAIALTKKRIKLRLVFDLEMVKNQETVIPNYEGKSRESNTQSRGR